MLAAVVAIDRASKAWVVEFFAARRAVTVEVLGDALRLTHVRNPGIVFGLLSEGEFASRGLWLAALSGVAIVVLTVFFVRAGDATARRFGLALVLGGAVGNLYCRVRFGYVVDFIDVSLYWARWPAFNVADAAIVTGVGLLALELRHGGAHA